MLSFRIFALLTTVRNCFKSCKGWLWIAFISYLCFIDNSRKKKLKGAKHVVNCFHFVSLLYWQQFPSLPPLAQPRCELLSFRIFALLTTVTTSCLKWNSSCELLSFRIFALLTTVGLGRSETSMLLWIAFISYLCFVDNSDKAKRTIKRSVVNCFHFVSLLYWQQ